jgi:muramidase (phage lysozyme)
MKISAINDQERAFLDMLAWAEIGPGILEQSDNGYNVLAGSLPSMVLTFSSYHRHPGALIDMDGKSGGLESTAAGRYQVLSKIYYHYKRQLSLPDFSPASQDLIAMQLIRECRAVDAINAGLFDQAVYKVRSRWASMPGAGYGQPEKQMAELQQVFIAAGGGMI